MPWGDRTAPAGFGPMTGRRMGFCGGFNVPGLINLCLGFGGGRRKERSRRTWGRGWRHWFPWQGGPFWVWNSLLWSTDPETEKDMLEQQARILEQELQEIRKRIDELRAKKGYLIPNHPKGIRGLPGSRPLR